ncbi:hypothetical protein ACOZ38_25300 [Sphaerisporangium viridialbum]|uniref:hypothetical protein n=1 Tax=Sphaerisporangium viridialbum TaxID=46189 RepID=UPI003C76C9FD
MDVQRFVPVHGEVEAVQITGENLPEVAAWIQQEGQKNLVVGEAAKVGLSGTCIDIDTHEGFRRAVIGDWVVRDGAGEFYRLRGSVFPRRLKTAG